MSFKVSTYSLSALQPIKLDYNFNSSEELDSKFHVLDNRLRYYTHSLFEDYADVAISRKNFLALTSIKDLNTVFKNRGKDLDLNSIAGNFYLEPVNNPIVSNEIVKLKNNLLYVGGFGENALFTTSPVKDNIVEIRLNGHYVYVDEKYPYYLKLSENPLDRESYNRQLFTVELFKNSILFRANIEDKGITKRYVSFNNNRQLAAIGLNLNETVVNQYLFKPIFVSSTKLPYNYNPTVKEVRYYNDLQNVVDRKQLTIKTKKATNTHLLVSCTTKDLTKLSTSSANIALTKTKYGAEGTFNTEL